MQAFDAQLVYEGVLRTSSQGLRHIEGKRHRLGGKPGCLPKNLWSHQSQPERQTQAFICTHNLASVMMKLNGHTNFMIANYTFIPMTPRVVTFKINQGLEDPLSPQEWSLQLQDTPVSKFHSQYRYQSQSNKNLFLFCFSHLLGWCRQQDKHQHSQQRPRRCRWRSCVPSRVEVCDWQSIHRASRWYCIVTT